MAKNILALLIIIVIFILIFPQIVNTQTDIEKNVYDNSSIESLSNPTLNFNNPFLQLKDLCELTGLNKIPLKNRDYSFSVAILDSGIYPHKDLVENENRIIAFKDFVNKTNSDSYDDNGHGTAIAGIIGADGYISNKNNIGIAPFVNFISIKVLDSQCKGKAEDIINGINWAIENKEKYNIRIINISIGVINYAKIQDELCFAAEEAYNAGIIIVASAGNNTSLAYSPAFSKNTICVGSYEVDIDNNFSYRLAPYSSYWQSEEQIIKPDLLAPGTNII